MLVALGALMLSPAVWTDPAPKDRLAAPTAQLAAELLPPEMARDVVAHRVTKIVMLPSEPVSVSFDGRGRSTGDGFCVRKAYHVMIGASGKPEPVQVFDQIRMGGCEGEFAHTNRTASVDQAKQTLRWMAWARDQAAGVAPLPFAVDCKDETLAKDRCTSGARHVLMMLPIEKTFIMEKDPARPHVWRLSVPESGPGQLFWDVAVDGTPGKARIALAWQLPAPF